MDISSLKYHAWKKAEAELADIEKAFRALADDLAPSDRERVTQQLAALRAARLRVRLLFEEVMSESALLIEQLAKDDEMSTAPNRDSRRQGSEDWLS